MTALVFLFAVALIFGTVLAIEVSEAEADSLKPRGLIAWLTGGNWPAKVGGGLLVVGVGALLRYALINFDVAPPIKLAVGMGAAGVLGLAATLTRMGGARRAVSLALGGAAFGVAYLTAYSAFALFHYLESTTGIALLALTAAGAGVYAITRSALSLALLSMLGAFLAPAFALTDPGPFVVYGYYVGASLLSLVMVAARGWRPLIHLSFLFTLAGGVFFAWTAHYYQGDNAAVMLPILLILAAIHVVMPLVERHATRGDWIEKLDILYALALPAVSALAAYVVAPSRIGLSNEMLAFGAIWAAAAAYLWLAKRDGMALHAVIAVLLVGLGAAARFEDLPWELIALAFTVGALWLAAARSESTRLHNVLAGLVPIFGFLHITSSLSPVPGSPILLNGRVLERLIGAALLMFAGHICRRIRQSLDTLLWTVGIGWALITVGAELVRWDLVSLPLLLHWTLIAAAIVLTFTKPKSLSGGGIIVFLALGTAVTASWAAVNAPLSISWASMLFAPLGLIALSLRDPELGEQTRTGRMLAALLAPLAAAIWATHAGDLSGIHAGQFATTIGEGVIVLVLLAAHFMPWRSADWHASVARLSAYVFALTLISSTLLAISRSPWAVTMEVTALMGLIWLALAEEKTDARISWVKGGAAVGAALVIQACLLRWLGPPGELTLADLANMRYPPLISLLWAAMGAALTVWGRHRGSRSEWVAGAALLVAAAVKLVLMDFGSLGQLTNILAVIAAGIVFMLVGWLAPMPPAAPATPSPTPAAEPSPKPVSPPPASTATTAPTSRAQATPPPRAQAASAPRPAAASAPVDTRLVVDGDDDKASDFSTWNSPRQTPPPQDDPATNASSKNAWTIAIIAVLVLPLAHCSRTTFETARRELNMIRQAQTEAREAQANSERPPPPPPPAQSQATVSLGTTQPAVARRVDIAPPPQLTALPAVENECTQWAARLPAEFTVFAAGAYKGHELDFTIDDSNHRASRFDVLVHQPDRNVVLMLGAYEPSIWNIKWSRDTHIVGVWISGYYAGQVNGLEPGTPVLRNNATAHTCPYFYMDPSNLGSLARAVSVLHTGISNAIHATDGRVYIGRTELTTDYVQGDVRPIEDFRNR